MKIDNTLDALLYTATAGIEPDSEDLAAVVVPPGEDATAYRHRIKATASRVVGLRRDGLNAAARDLAATTSSEYMTAFESATPTPADAETEDFTTITERMFGR